MQTTRSKGVRADAIRWTYNLLRSARAYSGDPSPETLGLYVPALNGEWVPAAQAVFSGGWSGTHGDDLEELIHEAGAASSDLGDLAQRLLASPADWPFKISDVPAFRDFLIRIGVSDGLPIRRAGQESATYEGKWLTPDALGNYAGLGERTQALWREAVSEVIRPATYPSTPYRLEGGLWFLPGQEEFEDFSDLQKDLYSRQVLIATQRLGDEHMTVRFRRDRGGDSDTHEWPTPLAAFLRDAPWLPQTEPGDRGRWSYVQPPRAWHFVGLSGETAPTYAPLLPHSHQQLIESEHHLDFLVRNASLLVWDDPHSAPDLLYQLPDLFEAGYVEEPAWPAFSKAYQRAWADLSNQDMWEELIERLGDDELPIIVTRGGRPEVLWLDHESQPILIDDVRETLASRLLSATSQPVLSPLPAAAAPIAAFLAGRSAGVRTVSELEVWVEADGERVLPSTDAPPLVDSRTAWLPSLVGLIVELKAGQFVRRGDEGIRRSLARLRSMRVVQANRALVTIDGSRLELPEHLEDVLPVYDEIAPTLVFIGGSVGDWSTLQRLSPAICELLGQQSLTAELRLTLRELESIIGSEIAAPTPGEFARALHLSEDTIKNALQAVRADIAQTRHFLLPAIAVIVGVDTARELLAEERLQGVTDEASLVAAIADDRLALPADELVNVCAASSSLDDLRSRLNIDLARFNEVLAELGSPYKLIELASEHAAAFDEFVGSERSRIMDALRARFAGDFRNRVSLAPYVDLREMRTLTPESDWSTHFEEVPHALMRVRIEAWAVGNGIELDAEHDFLPVEEVRALNLQRIGDCWDRLRATVASWCRTRDVTLLPPVFGDETPQALQALLDENGSLDFEPLDVGTIVLWLGALGAWPESMPLVPDALELGVDERDIAAEQERASREERARDFEQQSVAFREERFTDSPNDFARLAKLVRESVSAELLESPTTPADLTDASPMAPRTGPRGSLPRGRQRRASDTQKLLIGLSGEVVALEWLKANYRAASDESWKSTYRFTVVGGDVGDDSLGYDFLVPRSKGPLIFEVKSTTGDDRAFELGESEVRVAQEHARNDRYRVIFIQHALDEEHRRLIVLPNPFGNTARGRYKLVGSGLRYRFNFADVREN